MTQFVIYSPSTRLFSAGGGRRTTYNLSRASFYNSRWSAENVMSRLSDDIDWMIKPIITQ